MGSSLISIAMNWTMLIFWRQRVSFTAWLEISRTAVSSQFRQTIPRCHRSREPRYVSFSQNHWGRIPICAGAEGIPDTCRLRSTPLHTRSPCLLCGSSLGWAQWGRTCLGMRVERQTGVCCNRCASYSPLHVKLNTGVRDVTTRADHYSRDLPYHVRQRRDDVHFHMQRTVQHERRLDVDIQKGRCCDLGPESRYPSI